MRQSVQANHCDIARLLTNPDRAIPGIDDRFGGRIAAHHLQELRPDIRPVRAGSAARMDYFLDMWPGDTLVICDFRSHQRDVLDFPWGGCGATGPGLLPTGMRLPAEWAAKSKVNW